MKRLAILLMLAAAPHLFAQRPDQVRWSLAFEPDAAAPGATVLGRLKGELQPGWHLYSFSTAGATPTSVKLADGSPLASFKVYQPKPHIAFDPNFNSDTETYDKEVTFLIEGVLRQGLAAGPAEIVLNLRYQTCSDKMCVPGKATVSGAAIRIDPAAKAAPSAIPAGYAIPAAPGSAAPSSSGAPAPQGWGGFLAVAFGFGLAAIFTPCVFPMIPITMSYFLNRQTGSRKDGVLQAAVFCLGIVILFSSMGLAITAVLGPFGVVQLGSNPWVNGFISVLFIFFGLSLLGAFEITIPSFILTKLDKGAQGGGFLGSLLMGLTFSLASFACVGPFVGTLLAASVQGGGVRPLAGMVAFAFGLALPFFLLALFPGYLKRMPKSGGWMSRVKVVLGFVILAASLKYLASLDQVLQFGWITRERFLAAWIVLFGMAGVYLLGFLRLEGVKADEPLKLPRLLIGTAFLVFAISLLPGMSGGRLGELDAFVPAAAEGSGARDGSGPSLAWMKNQYREAIDRAKREGKLVLVNFTGYACTNCHWMKANMFPRPEVAAALGNFILLELYTDGTDEASRLNQDLQLSRFQTVAIPFYAILDGDEKTLATFPGLTKDTAEFTGFLAKGSAAPAPVVAASAPAPPAPAAPSAAPAPSALPAGLTGLDGKPVDSMAGKVVVVNFWATWCVPCIQEIPSFNKLHKSFAPKGVAVLGVSMDEEGPDKVRSFLKKHPMEYPIAMGTEKLNGPFQLDQLPVTVVFDKSGKVVKRFEGFTAEADLEKAVSAAL
jgi:thiol:disulfide interchange protein DsbD